MKQPARGLACILFGAVACSAAVAEARPATLAPENAPVVLTEVEMDDTTAGAHWRVQSAAQILSRILQRVNLGAWQFTPGATEFQGVQSSSGNGTNTVTTTSYNRSYRYSSHSTTGG